MGQDQPAGMPADESDPVRREMSRRRLLLRAAAGSAAATAGIFTPPRITSLDLHPAHAGASKDQNKDNKDNKDIKDSKDKEKDNKDIKDKDKDNKDIKSAFSNVPIT